jgi:Uma2 family endonuclease
MMALSNPEFITVEKYLAGELERPVKHEYLGGVVYAMAGATNRHNDIALNILASWHSQLKGMPCRPSNSDTKVRIESFGHTRFYYPDAMVICDRNDDNDSYQENPVVIVEVTSKSTRRIDMNEKRDAYLSIPSMNVYVIVEQEKIAVTVYCKQADGTLESEFYASLEDEIPLTEVEAMLPLREVFDRIDFPIVG